MAIYIKIDKIKETKDSAIYKIYEDDYKTADFFMEINKTNNTIKFFLTDDFTHPVKIFNKDSDSNEPIGSLTGKSMMSYSRALLKGIKLFNQDNFPDVLDYCA